MSLNVWNRPSGSFMVDMGISSNIMKSPSPKCYMTFWGMTIYNDTLNWSDITPIYELITELDFITDFDIITKFWRFPYNIATGAASQQRTLTPPDTWSCPIWDLHLFLCWDHSFLNLSCLRTFWDSNIPRYFYFAPSYWMVQYLKFVKYWYIYFLSPK